jgi:hypothetical protein
MGRTERCALRAFEKVNAMTCYLRPGLSYCLIDGHPIFLDIDEDRYFRLEGPQEAQFLAHTSADATAQAGIAQPVWSAIELATGPGPGSASVVAILQVSALTLRMRHQLHRRAFKDVLHDVVRCREATTSQVDEARTLEAAGRFLRARLYVPVEPTCLLDSLALTAYLAARGVPANIVFGVTGAPFSAHCWVQAGDLVLNDTVGNAMAYMPIRVV